MLLLRTLSSSNLLGLRLLVRHSSLLVLRSSSMDTVKESLPNALSENQSAVEAQGNAVQALKAVAVTTSASKQKIDAAIEKLNKLKLNKASIEKQLQAHIGGAGRDGSISKEALGC